MHKQCFTYWLYTLCTGYTLYERMHKQCFTYRLAKSGLLADFNDPCVCSSKLFSFSRSYQHCHKLLQHCSHIFLPQFPTIIEHMRRIYKLVYIYNDDDIYNSYFFLDPVKSSLSVPLQSLNNSIDKYE